MANEDGKDDRGRVVTIIVNAKKYEVAGKEITFEKVVKLAFPAPPPGSAIVYTVTYRKAEGKKAEGALSPGESVKVRDGTTFNVSATDKS